MKPKKKTITSKDIARRVRAQRLKARFTRDQVASLLAISLPLYIDLEEGNVKLADNFCEDFANLYNQPLDFFQAEDSVRDLINEF